MFFLWMRCIDGYIQLEVSEWTLPGPSVGDVTDEGVGASCQPPFVLMPCGLYIWLAARLSLYPPVWLITWRRVSTCWIGSWWGVCLAAVSRHTSCIDCGPRCVHIGLFLELADVFLVSDSLVPKPVWYLWHCDAAFFGQLFFGLLAGIGVTEMGVKVLV